MNVFQLTSKLVDFMSWKITVFLLVAVGCKTMLLLFKGSWLNDTTRKTKTEKYESREGPSDFQLPTFNFQLPTLESRHQASSFSTLGEEVSKLRGFLAHVVTEQA